MLEEAELISRNYCLSDDEVAELDLVIAWLRRRACLGDKHLTKALEKEMGHQVKPPTKAAKKIERLVKKKNEE
jgi:hypothetical protein